MRFKDLAQKAYPERQWAYMEIECQHWIGFIGEGWSSYASFENCEIDCSDDEYIDRVIKPVMTVLIKSIEGCEAILKTDWEKINAKT